MSINIRFPNINASTEKEQITQIRSYLHQLVEQMNYVLPTLVSGSGSAQTASTQTYEVQGGEISYYELRSLIIQETDKLDRLFAELSNGVDNKVDTAVEEALEEAKESGAFHGPQGEAGADGVSVTHTWEGTVLTVTSASGTSSADLKGEKGDPGEQGMQGVPGEVTEEEISAAAKQAAGRIRFTLDENGNFYYEVED